jgi:hypothetical protein
MALTVAHINKELTEREAAARQLWEQVLQPKWDAKLRAEAETFFTKRQNKKPADREPKDRA